MRLISVMLHVIMLSVVMLSVVVLSVAMLSVVMLSFATMSVFWSNLPENLLRLTGKVMLMK